MDAAPKQPPPARSRALRGEERKHFLTLMDADWN
jgi:hypothetical protein